MCNFFVGSGDDLCLNCVDTGNPTGPYVDGATWNSPSAIRRSGPEVDVGDDGNCTRQLPDRIGFGNGRKFRIYHDVPESASAELLRLRESDVEVGGDGLPEYLREYEIVE